MKNQFSALITSIIAYFAIWYIVAYSSGSTYLAYLCSDVVAAFIYAIVFIPTEEKVHFWSSGIFNYLFSTSLCYFVGGSLLFALLGLI
jgi:hypothetical protein